jgi:hypothetical protein
LLRRFASRNDQNRARRPALLEHAEHDGADKGERDIGRENAQTAHERHGMFPWFTCFLRWSAILPDRFFPKKSALLSLARPGLQMTRRNVVKEV